ncbi:MAG: cupin domain-containing protein [Chloroflexi bacterium]|nr:cupin domain-containing protein [Chloroflexota bacterium]
MTDGSGRSLASDPGEGGIRYGRSALADRLSKRIQELWSIPSVIKASSLAQHAGDRFVNQLVTTDDNSPLSTIVVFIEYIPPGGRSSKHGHMNDALFYILEGDGYDIHNGKRYTWLAGDVANVPPGVTHQHFNASATRPVRALVLNPKPLYLALNLMWQKQLETPFNPAHPDARDGHGHD